MLDIDTAKQILGEKSANMSDSQVMELLDILYLIGEIYIDREFKSEANIVYNNDGNSKKTG